LGTVNNGMELDPNPHDQPRQAFSPVPKRILEPNTTGIELLHPRREGRSAAQLGNKGLSN